MQHVGCVFQWFYLVFNNIFSIDNNVHFEDKLCLVPIVTL